MDRPIIDLMQVVTRGKTKGTAEVCWRPVSIHAAGNAEFFDPDPRCLVQLRPMLKSELEAIGNGCRANAILFVRGEGKTIDLLLYVRNPPNLRTNNKSGVVRALRHVAKRNKKIAKYVTEQMARTRWPSQG